MPKRRHTPGTTHSFLLDEAPTDRDEIGPFCFRYKDNNVTIVGV